VSWQAGWVTHSASSLLLLALVLAFSSSSEGWCGGDLPVVGGHSCGQEEEESMRESFNQNANQQDHVGLEFRWTWEKNTELLSVLNICYLPHSVT